MEEQKLDVMVHHDVNFCMNIDPLQQEKNLITTTTTYIHNKNKAFATNPSNDLDDDEGDSDLVQLPFAVQDMSHGENSHLDYQKQRLHLPHRQQETVNNLNIHNKLNQLGAQEGASGLTSPTDSGSQSSSNWSNSNTVTSSSLTNMKTYSKLKTATNSNNNPLKSSAFRSVDGEHVLLHDSKDIEVAASLLVSSTNSIQTKSLFFGNETGGMISDELKSSLNNNNNNNNNNNHYGIEKSSFHNQRHNDPLSCTTGNHSVAMGFSELLLAADDRQPLKKSSQQQISLARLPALPEEEQPAVTVATTAAGAAALILKNPSEVQQAVAVVPISSSLSPVPIGTTPIQSDKIESSSIISSQIKQGNIYTKETNISHIPYSDQLHQSNLLYETRDVDSSTIVPANTNAVSRYLIQNRVRQDVISNSILTSRYSRSRELASLAGASARRTGSDAYQISIDLQSSNVSDVVNILSNPELLRLWCDPLMSGTTLLITKSSEGARTSWNWRDENNGSIQTGHGDDSDMLNAEQVREYEGEWMEGTILSPLIEPNTNTYSSIKCIHRTSQLVTAALGCPSYGKFSMFVERQKGQVSLVIGSFSGGIEVHHSIHVIPVMNDNNNNNNGVSKVRVIDDVRLRRRSMDDHHLDDNGNNNMILSSVLGCCGLMSFIERCWLPLLDDYIDQGLSSMARLRFLVENGAAPANHGFDDNQHDDDNNNNETPSHILHEHNMSLCEMNNMNDKFGNPTESCALSTPLLQRVC